MPKTQPEPKEDTDTDKATGPFAVFVIAFKTIAAIPSEKLILMALLGAFGTVLYAVGWMIPQAHRETIGIITNSAEQERELDRKARREEGEIDRREKRDQNEKLRNTIREENQKTRDEHSRDTEKLRTEFRMGIDEIKRTKSGGGFSPHPDDTVGPQPRVKVGSPKDE